MWRIQYSTFEASTAFLNDLRGLPFQTRDNNDLQLKVTSKSELFFYEYFVPLSSAPPPTPNHKHHFAINLKLSNTFVFTQIRWLRFKSRIWRWAIYSWEFTYWLSHAPNYGTPKITASTITNGVTAVSAISPDSYPSFPANWPYSYWPVNTFYSSNFHYDAISLYDIRNNQYFQNTAYTLDRLHAVTSFQPCQRRGLRKVAYRMGVCWILALVIAAIPLPIFQLTYFE